MAERSIAEITKMLRDERGDELTRDELDRWLGDDMVAELESWADGVVDQVRGRKRITKVSKSRRARFAERIRAGR